MKYSRQTILTLMALLTLFIIDRISKYLVLNKLQQHGVYLFKYLQIQVQTNPGIAFSILLPSIIIIILIVTILIFLYFYFWQNLIAKKYWPAFHLGLIIIGASSNLLDRIIYKEVIDFIQISIWPTFNLADTYISIGAILFLIMNIKKDSK